MNLDGTPLAVSLFTDTSVVASLPPGFLPGSYALTLTPSAPPAKIASFVVTIGAVRASRSRWTNGRSRLARACRTNRAQGPQGPAGAASFQSVCSALAGGLTDYNSLTSLGCTVPPRYVFVTTNLYAGNFGGVPLGDAICQTEAATAGLPGKYKVWLSDSTSRSPSSTFTHPTVPYQSVSEGPIASSWTNLVTSGPIVGIGLTDAGTVSCATQAPLYCFQK